MVTGCDAASLFAVRDVEHWGNAERVVACDQVDDTTRDVFTTGWCWAFAEAFSALHGGTIVCVGDDDGIWTHVLVRVGGHLYDIGGHVTNDMAAATWAGQLWDADEDTVTDFPLTSANPDDARTLARIVAPLIAVLSA